MRSTTFPLAFPTKRAKSASDFPTKGGRGLFILLQHQEGRNKTVAVACMVAQRTGSAGGRGRAALGCTRLTPRPSPGPVGSAPSFIRACSRASAGVVLGQTSTFIGMHSDILAKLQRHHAPLQFHCFGELCTDPLLRNKHANNCCGVQMICTEMNKVI